MSHSRLIPKVIKLKLFEGIISPMEWKGKATVDNVTKYVQDFEESCLPGGCNQHLGINPVLSAEIIDQKKGITLVTWKRSEQIKEPMFQLV